MKETRKERSERVIRCADEASEKAERAADRVLKSLHELDRMIKNARVDDRRNLGSG